MTEQEIQTVKHSNDCVEEAMKFVQRGEATLIEFSRDHIIGQCGKERKNIEQGNAMEFGGWANVADLVRWESIADDLLSAEGTIIVPGGMTDEPVAFFIDQMEQFLAIVAGGKDIEEVLNSERRTNN